MIMPRVNKILAKESAVDGEEVLVDTKKTTTRRRRPSTKKAINRRGRPKGAATVTKTIDRKQQTTQSLRQKVKEMRSEIRATKSEFKIAIKQQKEVVQATQRELKEALKREQALIKLFDLKEKAVSNYAERWTAQQIAKIQSSPNSRRRKKKAA